MKYILVVDDHQENLDLLGRVLSRLGCAIEYCQNGMDALDYIQAHPNSLDLIITDWRMPIVSGLDVCRAAAPFDIPTILLSAYDGPEDRRVALDCGAVAHLVKPFDMQHFRQVVQQHVASNVAEAAENND